MPMPPPTVTPPMTAEAAGGMPMGGPPGMGAGVGPSPEDINAILAELQAMGVQMQPGPNGTLILSGIPAEALGMGGGAPPAPGVGGGGSPGLV